MCKSRCCKADVDVYSANEGTSFYICMKCELPCDLTGMNYYRESINDTRRETETQKFIGAA